jgi:inward rectifier potassium channel
LASVSHPGFPLLAGQGYVFILSARLFRRDRDDGDMAKKHRGNDTAGMVVRQDAFQLTKTGGLKYDWRDPYHLALTLSWPYFVAVFIALNIAINIIFALLYFASPGSIANVAPGSLSENFFFSLQTLATVGYGVMAPQTVYGHVVASIEIFCGMAYTAIMTGLVFVRFSRPRARFAYAEQAVVCHFNGQPTLMIRIANRRLQPLTEATARLAVLLSEWSAEGLFYRRIYDLDLTRARLPIFPLTWTLMHVIDDHSPLKGVDTAAFEKTVTRLILSVDARDPALAARVYDTKDYDPADVLFGHRYADAVTVDAAGRTIADLNRLGWTEPETALPQQN